MPDLDGHAHCRPGIALFAILASLALSGGACAQSSPDAPAATPPAISDPEPSGVSAWDAPEPWRTDRFFLATSVYTRHFKYDPAHNDDQNLMLGEWNVTEHWLVGAAQFDNSFGQVTQYVYGGYRARPLPDLQAFYFKVSAGLIHGYKDEYAKKIPLNDAGVAPVIIPTLGYCLNRFCSELVFFGAAGVMLTFGVTIP